MNAECYVLAFNQKRHAWLIAFDDPDRGITPDTPCYISLDFIAAFTAIDGESGEVLPPGSLGFGVITIPQQIWNALPSLVASALIERERIAARERKAAQDAIDRHPSTVRRKEDRMLRARRARR